MILKVLLLLVAVPAVMVGLIHVALRVLRWARANRAEAATGLATGLLPQWMTDGIDSWVSDSAASEGGHSDTGADHHHHDSGDHGD